MVIVAETGTSFLQIISGIILIWSVISIRNFLKSSGQSVQQIDIKTLLLHSSAFALYIISVVVLLVFYLLDVIYESGPRVYGAYNAAHFFIDFILFFSQVLLCMIFLKMGDKHDADATA